MQGSGPITLEALEFDEKLSASHYDRIAIRTLLWLFHYVFDTTYEPSFSRNMSEHWAGYRTVNERFAQAILHSQSNSADEVVLIHDFHLMMVPTLLTEVNIERRNKLVYFHHVPWCAPDYFAVLPEWIRTPILNSLLQCDVVGFHSQRWANAFVSCCERFLPEVKIDGYELTHRGNRSAVVTAPGPIDAQALDILREDPITAAWRDNLHRRARGRAPIVRVDRLDLWKNVIRGFEAFELILDREPGLARDLWFCAIVTPPRKPTDRTSLYRARCEETVARINAKFRTGDVEPISLVYPGEADNTRHRAVAALEISAATLVNPTLDGLNMVAKESVVVGSAAPLLLSVNAGAYEELRSGVLPIHPFDVESTAEALLTAIGSGAPTTMANCRIALRQETAASWLRALLAEPTS
ncbi:trehalose-6-phosphate synthase [Nocardia xishanensis]